MRLLNESRLVLRSSFFYFGSHACIDDKPVKRSAYRYGYRHPLRKFQVVIPLAIREALHLTPSEKLRVLAYSDRVEFIPVRPSQQMRGFLRGMDTSIEREDDRL